MFQSPVRRLIFYLGSANLTVWLLLVLLAVLFVCYLAQVGYMWLYFPLAAIMLNLLMALFGSLSGRYGRLIWWVHFLLLAFLICLVMESLTGFEGRIEIAEGQSFSESQVVIKRAGRFAAFDFSAIEFVQGPVEIHYGPDLQRARTESTIFLGDSEQGLSKKIGDLNRAYFGQYRISSTSNKGYAALLEWQGNQGGVERGFIHFPSYPLRDWQQTQQWQAPSGDLLNLTIDVLPPETDKAWRMTIDRADQLLRVEVEGLTKILTANSELEFESGSLKFLGIHSWIGYKVDSHPWFIAMLLTGFTLLITFLCFLYMPPVVLTMQEAEC